MFRVTRPLGAFSVAITATLALAAPALAQSDLVVSYDAPAGTITRSRAVEINDLQLNTAAGRAALDKRITLAARQVCGYHGMYGLRQPADYVRCYDKAKGDAMSEAPVIQTASLD
ncbi:UrcA family protein [Sphingobium sp. AN641]|uniref:UrcA family protein n=1 Tax=Sphingobium sp. AN641 TaxID=3133443 RepID=UPI0030C55670